MTSSVNIIKTSRSSCAKFKPILNDHILRGNNILPPVIVNSIFTARDPREMVEPPLMVRADITTAPLRRTDHPHIPFEIGEVQLPVITLAFYRGGISPIVILLAVRRKVDIAARGFSRAIFSYCIKRFHKFAVPVNLLKVFSRINSAR